MGLLDRLFGRKEEPRAQPAAPPYGPDDRGQQAPDADEQALQHYRYMLKTAPPETIEQAHEEAFAKLTPDQRAQALRELAAETQEGERASLAGGRDDPKSLARLATRAEVRQPGTMERIFGGMGRGPGMGGMMGGMGGTILTSLAGGFVGSMIAQEFIGSMGDFGEGDTSEQSGDGGTADNSGDNSSSGDYGSDDSSGGDYGGGDYGGGDFGGGDYGGGDFGGGDF
ncbi:MAG: hypothetical protein LC751_16460 [Actinobacteria bacterium]|nr:hypothetical protein [Actinomycetota bacterium]MCA1740357.1 hypothetical protein [Actinomycetota bacterium]